MFPKNSPNGGQTMLLAVLLIGASAMVFASISGYMTLVRIRASSDITDATKAIIAADAGVECELYNFFVPANLNCSALQFDDVKTSVETQIGDSDSDGTNDYIKSIGTANKSKRAFMVSF
ncbi:MAG: hypothetical protein AAB464_00485 [Patescibacteria group bacterium]